MINGDEYDAYTQWRKYLCYLQRAGVVKKIKRRTHKRERREAQQQIKEQLEDQ
jgi:hypothetical protein